MTNPYAPPPFRVRPRRLCHGCGHIRETRWSLDCHAFLCDECHHDLAAWIELHPHLPTSRWETPMTPTAARMFCRICDRPRPEAEHHAEALRWRAEPCYAGHDCAFTCSLDEGHDGPHEAMTDSIRVVARWSR